MQSTEANATSFPEGSNGKIVAYKERLLPGPFSWILIFVMTASLGIAYGDVYGITFGFFLTGFSTIAIYLVMYFSSPIVLVDDLVLQVGNARLPLKFVSQPQILDAQQTAKSRRLPAPKNAYLTMRASISESILVQVGDLTDPHPYWQFSSRNPKQVLKALADSVTSSAP